MKSITLHASAGRSFPALLIAAALSACTPAPDAGAPQPVARAAFLPDFSDLLEAQGPAVVNVVTAREAQAPGAGLLERLPDDPVFDFFRRLIPELSPEEPERQVQGVGSGFVIDPAGLILTSAHVVADARRVTVRMADGTREFPGEVLGVDQRTDIALIRIEAEGLPTVRTGDSGSIRPGQWVAAIGSPFGLHNTITAGIVSATGRALSDESLVPFIQTDVAVNPGNSGGPLLNLQGEVIGVNSMILSRTGGFMGVSFAVPIEVALDVARQLQAEGKVTRGRLGVVIQAMTPDLAQALGLDRSTGVAITQVTPDGPAGRAGLRAGDVVLAYEGEAIDDPNTLPQRVAGSRPGSQVSLDIWRQGERYRLPVTLGELPADQPGPRPEPQPAAGPEADRFGLVVTEIPPAERAAWGIEYGLMVESVSGPAMETPLQPGDVIVSVNQTPLTSREQFDRLMNAVAPGDPVALLVRRDEGAVLLALQTPAPAPAPAAQPR